jgi:dephospho-CoA kinase
MLVVALTGNIASGKSTVAQRLAEHGAWLVDADVLAREVVAPGTPALQEIVERWGTALRRPDGSLDRGALRRIAFADESERLALNAIVHPRVEALRQQRVEQGRAAGAKIVVCDIPLLFESGRDRSDSFDAIILVTAPEPVRLARLTQTRALARDEAQRMIDAQMSEHEKRTRADIVIDNAGSRDALLAQVDALWDSLLARARSHP